MKRRLDFHFWHETEPIGVDITANTLAEAKMILTNNIISPLMYELKYVIDKNGNEVKEIP